MRAPPPVVATSSNSLTITPLHTSAAPAPHPSVSTTASRTPASAHRRTPPSGPPCALGFFSALRSVVVCGVAVVPRGVAPVCERPTLLKWTVLAGVRDTDSGCCGCSCCCGCGCCGCWPDCPGCAFAHAAGSSMTPQVARSHWLSVRYWWCGVCVWCGSALLAIGA